MRYNDFSAELTTIICEALKSLPSIKRIIDLKMSQSMNFAGACEHSKDFFKSFSRVSWLTCSQFISEGRHKIVATIECADVSD